MKTILQMGKAFCIAFSIYSKIPVPIFEWKEEDMQYHLLFFPWIGAVVGVLLVGWNHLCSRFAIGEIAYVLIGCAIPLLITGGFHVDGYMDSMDAFRSYKSKEEKLEILKDPHIGAFAVIMLAVLGLLYAAGFSEIAAEQLPVFAAGFFLTRTLSGIGVLYFPSAKKKGMLYTFSSTAKGKAEKFVKVLMQLQLILCAAFMIWLSPLEGSLLVAVALTCFLYYYRKTKKELGGITGDTAGYFVTITECAMALAAGACCLIVR